MLKILSAGAINRGLRALLKEQASPVELKLATAPQILELFRSGGTDADVVIAPRGTMDKLSAEGKLGSGDMLRIGAVGVGIMVKPGAELPDVSTVEAFKQALLGADIIVYNRASTGLYVGKMLQDLDVHDKISGRIVVVEDANAVVERVNGDEARPIGFTGTTEIMHQQDEGHVRYAGPLPDALQQVQDYWAAATAGGDKGLATAFLERLSTPDARDIFRRSGVEF